MTESKKDEQGAKGITRRDLLQTGATASGAIALSSLTAGTVLAGDPAVPQIPTRVLGKTKKKIPILVFGAAMKLDKRFDPKLAEAVRYGCTYFDTADCYSGGTSESAVGNFLQRTKLRDKVWITSKSDRHDPDGLVSVLDVGLKKLQTDHVDLYYLHALKEPPI